MRKLLFVFALFFFIPFTLLAQNKTIKGNVVDENGKPTEGVTITVKGNKKELTQTDKSGNFSIAVAENGKVDLIFTSTQYKTQTITADGTENLSVKLETQITTGDEVIVVGYDVVKRKYSNVTLSTVDKTQLKDIPVNSAAEALTGRLAGVQVTSDEGQPGADATINIRGKTSITQDGSPLYIVDGIRLDDGLNSISPQDIDNVVVLKDAAATAIYGASGANGVIIITTKSGKNTKGKTTVSYNGQIGYSQLPHELGVMDPYNFVAYQWERESPVNFPNTPSVSDSSILSPYATSWDSVLAYKNKPLVDWQHLVFGQNAFQQTHNVSISGGTDITQYNLSFTDNEQQGILLNTGYNRKLVSFKLDHKLNDKAKMGFNVRYNANDIDGSDASDPGTTSLNNLRQSIRYTPILLPGQTIYTNNTQLENATYAAAGISLINPLLLQQQQYRQNQTTILNLNSYFSYTLTRYLTFKSTFGYDVNSQTMNAFNDTITIAAYKANQQPTATINTILKTTLDNSNVLSFNAGDINSKSRFNDKNDLTALIGQELYLTDTKTTQFGATLFPIGITAITALENMGQGIIDPSITNTTEIPSNVASFFSKVNYAYDKKYFLSYSFRADGTSKFEYNPERQWGYFNSGQFAWKIYNENFMKKVSFITDLKLRASLGEAGNNKIADFAYLTQFTGLNPTTPATNIYYYLNGQPVVGLAPPANSLANDFLIWETTVSKNIGLDVSMFKNRLNLTTDVYWNHTINLLIDNQSLPTSTGYTAQYQNIGSTTNNGVEFQLSAIVIKKKDFNWTANFNLSFNKNLIQSLGDAAPILVSSGAVGNADDFIIKAGTPVGSMYGYVSDGFYKTSDFTFTNGTPTLKPGVANDQGILGVAPAPGVMKLKSVSHTKTYNGLSDSLTTSSDRTIIGNPNPKFYGGLNQQFGYKGFDFSIFINFTYGDQVLNANKIEFTSGYTPGANLLSVMDGRWSNIDPTTGKWVTDSATLSKLNAKATIWSPLINSSTNAFIPVSWAIEDASFIRINNVTLGYSLPVKFLKRFKVSKLRLFATVNNLAVITNYSGYDPEVNTRRASPTTPNVDYSAYPRSRTYIIGVNLSL